MIKQLIALFWGALLISSSLSAAEGSSDDDQRLVDGKAWSQSSLNEKRAYVMGVSDLMSVEYLFQKKSGRTPTDKQTTIQEAYRNLKHYSVDEVIRSVDAFYKNKPDQKSLPVLGAVFLQLIEPREKKN